MKQVEKEERLKKAEEERAKRRALAGKGRFDSSSEDEDEGHADDERSRSKSRQSVGAEDEDGEPVYLAKRHVLPVEDLRTEEEKKDDAMVAVRFIMMSLLMDATDSALRSSITECIRDAKHEGLLHEFVSNSMLLRNCASACSLRESYSFECIVF